jgi:hypothetical protein
VLLLNPRRRHLFPAGDTSVNLSPLTLTRTPPPSSQIPKPPSRFINPNHRNPNGSLICSCDLFTIISISCSTFTLLCQPSALFLVSCHIVACTLPTVSLSQRLFCSIALEYQVAQAIDFELWKPQLHPRRGQALIDKRRQVCLSCRLSLLFTFPYA